jgi:RHS repeat-associated protein
MRADYDALGREVIQTDVIQAADSYTNQPEVDRITVNGYDANGNLLTVSVGSTSNQAYDPTWTDQQKANWLSQRRDTKYVYDGLNRKIAMVEAYDPTGVLGTINSGLISGVLSSKYGTMTSAYTYGSPTTTYQYDAAGNVLSVANPRGVQSQYAYDVLGELVSDTEGVSGPSPQPDAIATTFYPGASQTKYTYDSAGRLIKGSKYQNQSASGSPAWIDTLYEYDAYDRKTATVEAANTAVARRTEIVYDAAGNTLRVTTGISPTNTIAQDDSQAQTTGAQPRQYAQVQVTAYQYDPLGRVTVQQSAAGLTDAQALAEFGHTAPQVKYTYNSLGNVIQTETNISGGTNTGTRIDRYKYDILNRLVATQQGALSSSGTQSLTRLNLTIYDAADNKILTLDSRGVVTRYEYDGQNQLVKQKVYSGDGADNGYITTKYTRDVWGDVTSTVSPQSTVTYAFDRLGRLTRQVYIDPSVKLPNSSHYTEFGYDVAGNRVLVRDMVLTKIVLSPTSTTQSQWASEYRSDETWSVYDPLNRVVATYDPGNRATLYKFDTLGEVIEKQDRNYTTSSPAGGGLSQGGGPAQNYTNRITTYAYDALGRLTNESWYTDPNKQYYGSQRYVYDAADHIIVDYRTRGDGSVFFRTERFYDSLGREIKEMEPVGGYLQFKYDAVGNMIQITDSWGGVENSQYDALGRLTWRSANLQNDPQNGIGFSINYKPIPAADPKTPTDWATYSGTLDLAQTTDAYPTANKKGAQAGFEVTNLYRPDGQLSNRTDSRWAPLTNKFEIAQVSSYGYYSSGLVSEEHNHNLYPQGFVGAVAYTYDPLGQVASTKVWGLGLKEAQTSTTQSDPVGGQPFATQTAALAALGNRPTSWNRTMADEVSVGNIFNGFTPFYFGANSQSGSSEAYRLLQLQGTPASYLLTYDGEGNVVASNADPLQNSSITASDNSNYSYDHRNRLSSVDRVSNLTATYTQVLPINIEQTKVATYVHTYSAQMNTHVDYQYDAENRLVARTATVTGHDELTVTAANGDVVAHAIKDRNNSNTTYFIYVGNQLYGELDGSGNMITRYVYDSGGQLLGRLDTPKAGGSQVYYYATDRQGSVLSVWQDNRKLVFDSSSRVFAVKSVFYVGGGVMKRETGHPSFDDWFEYTGLMFDPLSGLQYNNARWYNPSFGRFMSQDPLGFGGGDTNLYRYVHGSYPNATDPSGTFAVAGAVLGALGYVATWAVTPGQEFNTVDFLASTAAGAVGFGLFGALRGVSSAGAFLGASAISSGVGGATGAFISSTFGQLTRTGQVDWRRVGTDTALGFGVGVGTGLLGGAIGAGIFRGIGGTFGAAAATTSAAAFRQTAMGAFAFGLGNIAGGTLGGGIQGGVSSWMNGGSFWDGFYDGARHGYISSFMGFGLGGLGLGFGRAIRGTPLEEFISDRAHGRNGTTLQGFFQDLAGFTGTLACFVAGTPLEGEFGAKAIEQFKSFEEYGEDCDRIISRSEFDPEGVLTIRKVLRKFVRSADVLNLHAGGRIIGTTAEHPFYVRGKGWIAAYQLQIGDEIKLMDGGWIRVDGIADSGRRETVYNLLIEGDHTYFVGCAEWGFSVWAHNAYTPEQMQRAKDYIERLGFEVNTPEMQKKFARASRSGEHGTHFENSLSGGVDALPLEVRQAAKEMAKTGTVSEQTRARVAEAMAKLQAAKEATATGFRWDVEDPEGPLERAIANMVGKIPGAEALLKELQGEKDYAKLYGALWHAQRAVYYHNLEQLEAIELRINSPIGDGWVDLKLRGNVVVDPKNWSGFSADLEASFLSPQYVGTLRRLETAVRKYLGDPRGFTLELEFKHPVPRAVDALLTALKNGSEGAPGFGNRLGWGQVK